MAFSKLDEITSARKQRIGKIRRKRFAIFLAICLFFVVVYLAVTSYSEVTSKDAKDSINTFMATGSYPVFLGDNVKMVKQASSSMVLLTQSQMSTIKGSGSIIYSTYHGLTNAELAVNSNRIIVYSQSGKSYKVYNRSYLLFSGNTDYEIAGASVASSGRFCILTRGEEYTSELHVYNKDLSKRFTWYGTDGFPVDVVASESDDNVVIISVKGSEGRVITVLTVINLSTQKEISSFTTEGLIVDVVYEDDIITLVTDTQVISFKSDGTLQGVYSFNGKQLLKVAHQEGNYIVLCFGDNMRSEMNSVIILNKKLSESGKIDYHKEIHGVWVDTDELFILSRGVVDTFTLQGSLKRYYSCSTAAYSIFEWGGPVVIEAQYAVKLTDSNAPGEK